MAGPLDLALAGLGPAAMPTTALGPPQNILRILQSALAGQPLGDGGGLFPENQLFPQDPNSSPFVNTLRGATGEGLAIPLHILSAFNRDITNPLVDFFSPPSSASGPANSGAVAAGPLGAEAFDDRFGSSGVPMIPGMDVPAPGSGRGQTPPGGPRPPGTDYSEMDEWLKKAMPQAEDPARRDGLIDDLIWEGLASGAAGVSSHEPGSVGRLLAAAGAGAAGGKSKGEAYDIEADAAEGEADRDYALTMADVTGKRAQAAAAERAAAFRSMQPKVLSANANSVVIQRPNADTGAMDIEVIPIGESLDEGTNRLKLLRDLGAEDEVARLAQYEFFGETGNLPAAKIQIVEDAIADGQAPSIFGEAYAAHLADVEAEYVPTGDAEIDNQQIARQVAVRLYQDLDGNDDWIKVARDNGVYGARWMLEGIE